MTNSKIETAMSGLATWLAANFPTYLARANLGNTIPAAPTINGWSFSPALKLDRLPWGQVNLDSFTREDAGQGAQETHLVVAINIMVNMAFSDNFSRILVRYCDALVDCLAADRTFGGICTASSLESCDKFEEPVGDKARGVVAATLDITIESLC